MFKEFTIAAVSMLCLGQSLKAQQSQAKNLDIAITQPYTHSGMVFHKGDTLFLSAQADISVGKVLTKRFGRINACGFNIPEKDRPWGYDTYTNSQNYKNQNDKKLEHHGALLVYQMNGNNVLSVAEYCSLPVDPNDKTQKDATLKRKMLIFTQDNVEIVFGLNDKDVSNEEGFAKVSMDSHLKNTPGLVKQ